MTSTSTPHAWERLATALFVYGVAVTGGHLILIVAPAALAHQPSGAVVRMDAGVSLVFFAGAGVWIWQTRQFLRSLHDDARWMRYHWTAIAATVLILLDYGVVVPLVDAAPDAGRVLLADVLSTGSFVFGLIGLRLTRDRVRGIARGEIAPHSDDPRWMPPIVPAATTVRYDTLPAADTLSPADDSFWATAQRLARDAGADIAVLETTETLSRRWLLVPAGGDTAQLRDTAQPGAVLTLFPTAPGTAGALGASGRKAKPAPASEYYGLIQAAPHAPIRFQLVLPSRVPDFLAEAGTAHRAGLYRPNDPAAQTAAVPVSRS